VEERTREGMVLVTGLDVANAFNSLPWLVIRNALAEREVSPYLCNIIHSYLSDRWLSWAGEAWQR